MKKISSLIFILLACVFFAGRAIAQDKPKTEILSVKQKGETVRLELESSKPFVFGNNRYILYVGNKEITRNEQWHKAGKGYMIFLVPAGEFSNLKEGADMFLTYGQVNIHDEDMQALSQGRKCWPLGKFSKTLLK